jgi:general stress protein CsbA
MCFSAVSSISAGVALSGVGVLTLKKARSTNTEGVLWIALLNPVYSDLQVVATYNFLFFAQLLWPVWVPLGVLFMDPKHDRGIAIKIMLGIGVMVSLYLGYCLLNFPVKAVAAAGHIAYEQDYPAVFGRSVSYLYFLATVIPLFASRVAWMWLMGAAVTISLLISAILYTDYVISVWCFFSAVISMIVLLIIVKQNQIEKYAESE